MRIGLIVNPDAGLGGRLGFKGSDGRAEEARAAGAEDRSGPRVKQALSRLSTLVLQRPLLEELTFFVWAGRMGEAWLPKSTSGEVGWTTHVLGAVGERTGANDTVTAVKKMVASQVDLLIYGGGDGTTRDIVNTLEEIGDGAEKLPILGIPGGVKMHSGCFATTPNAAAEVIRAFLDGDLMPGLTEVMDLDEEIYLQGEWKVRMYGEAMTPSSPRWMQGAKEQVRAADESEIIGSLADHIQTLIDSNSELMIIWGSGGTLRQIGTLCGCESTLLGIDISKGKSMLGIDLNEREILKLLTGHDGDKLLLLSPMGGQGFLIGRGNLQLSPSVLKAIGLDNILGVVTPAKLLGLSQVRIDTGDDKLDEEFQNRRYVKLLQGFRTTRIMKIASE